MSKRFNPQLGVLEDIGLSDTGDTATGSYTFDTDTLHVNSTYHAVGIGINPTSVNFPLRVKKDWGAYTYALIENAYTPGAGVGSGFASGEAGVVKQGFRFESDTTGQMTIFNAGNGPLVYKNGPNVATLTERFRVDINGVLTIPGSLVIGSASAAVTNTFTARTTALSGGLNFTSFQGNVVPGANNSSQSPTAMQGSLVLNTTSTYTNSGTSRGMQFTVQNSGAGTVSTANALDLTVTNTGGGAITTGRGINIGAIAGSTAYAIQSNNGLVVFNEVGDALSDVRIEGDTDANLFFTDASADKVGIGLNNPAYKLDVNGDINIPAGSAYYVGTTAGISATVPVAPVLPLTVAGSMTFIKGILTAYTAPS